MADIDEVVDVWEEYFKTVPDWEKLVEGVEPKETGCGPVYELSNPIDRPNESFAIADMRGMTETEPHKHINDEVEIYFVLQGFGKIAIGGEMRDIAPGDSIVTPPDTVHITYPEKDLVLGVVNTPPFKADNYIVTPAPKK